MFVFVSSRCCRDYLDKRKGGDFGIATANSVALRQAGHPPYAPLDADDRFLMLSLAKFDVLLR